MEEGNTCEKCRFWNETGGTDTGLVGECRRNSPSPLHAESAVNSKIQLAVWPATDQNQWCGDFEVRPMDTKEVLERMAIIEKMEAARKSKRKLST